MKAHVNNLVLLLRVPVSSGAKVNRNLAGHGRRLHSDAPNVAAVRAAPAPVTSAEPGAPLTDLLGRRHNYLRISLTERCNLRCQYCMPSEGVKLSPRAALLSRDELSRTVRTFASLGVDKVRLTGGEPTLRADLADIIQDISSIDGINSVGMTTNGLVLTRKLPALQRAGLSAVNISLDSLKPERYERMARRPGLSRVLAGIDLALQLDYRPVKINVVLMKGFNDDEICDFVEYTRDREVEVRFIEFMPFSGNAWDDSKLVPHLTAVRALMERFPDALPCVPRPNDTSRVWQVPGFAGRVGFISSMTKNFCSTCNRLRLTADGNLKVCLFGAAEVSLRDALRAGASDEQLEAMIRTALNNKKPQHAARRLRSAATGPLRAATSYAATTTLRVPSALLVPPLLKHASTSRTTRQYSSYSRDSTSKLCVPSAFLVPPLLKQASSRTSRQYSSHSGDALTHLDPTRAICKPSAILVPSLLKQASSKPTRQYSSHSGDALTHLDPARTFRVPSALLVPSLLKHASCSRQYSSNALTHLDSEGRARMVDVGEKEVTLRVAEAECFLRVGGRLLRLLRDATVPKGDAMTVAQVAGVVGAKRTAELIPMCHPLPLDCVRINIHLPKGECQDGGDITVKCEVRVTAKTGAEMEALTGAATAALTLYDMCKSVDKHMRVTDLRVVKKSGGRSGNWPRESEPDVKVREYNKTPIKSKDAYIPANLMHI